MGTTCQRDLLPQPIISLPENLHTTRNSSSSPSNPAKQAGQPAVEEELSYPQEDTAAEEQRELETLTKNKLVVFIMAPGIILRRWLDSALPCPALTSHYLPGWVSCCVVYCHLAMVVPPQPLSIVNVMIRTL